MVNFLRRHDAPDLEAIFAEWMSLDEPGSELSPGQIISTLGRSATVFDVLFLCSLAAVGASVRIAERATTAYDM